MVFSGCGSKTEKIADAEKKNPDTIILLDEGKEISMAILDTKGKLLWHQVENMDKMGFMEQWI